MILLYERALKAMIQHFRQNGLSFVIHKGLGLAALLYPRPELRPCGGDFDVLIHQQDYPKAKALLEEIGYELDNIHSEQHEMSYIGEVKFIKHAGGKKLVVDLHTDFVANIWGKVSGFRLEGFWNSFPSVTYNDFRIPHLPVNVYLFFLSIHCAANHIFDRMITFCDLDLFIRKYEEEIDWNHIATIAMAKGSRKALYHALNYCRRLLGTPVPARFLEQIRPGALSIFLVPARFLLLRDKKPPKWLERYMHIMLLDNPLLVFRSVTIFVRRILEEVFLKRKTTSAHD